MNKYGYFKYFDFPIGAKSSAKYSTPSPLQTGSKIDKINVGYVPPDYQSFETNAYITDKPKKLYRSGDLSFVTAKVSDENGTFSPAITLNMNFENSYISLTGLTISSNSPFKQVQFKGYRDGTLISETPILEGTSTYQFFDFVAEKINKIEMIVSKIADAGKFLRVWSIDFGKIRIFDETTNISVEIDKKFSLIGDELPFDIANLKILANQEYFFQNKQLLSYYDGNGLNQNFYIQQGNTNDDKTADLMCYDDVSNLNADFLGGMYDSTFLTGLFGQIFKDSDVKFQIEFPKNTELSGYLPISSKGVALKQVMQAVKLSCYKDEILRVHEILPAPVNYEITESQIVAEPKPQIEDIQPVRKVTLKVHHYSKKTEETELYHWYMKQNVPTLVKFSAPMHDLKAYDVIKNEDGSETLIDGFADFKVKEANYCIIECHTARQLVIKGQGYEDTTVEYSKENPLISSNEAHEDKVIDLTLAPKSEADCVELLNYYYDLFLKTQKLRFITLIDVKVGYKYKILGKEYVIISKKNLLNGTYEVEAV